MLWFQVNDFEAVVPRGCREGAEIIQQSHIDFGPRHKEIWLRDSDGYVVVVARPDGGCGL